MIETTHVQRHLALLDPARFVQLANDLLSESAASNRIARACLSTNLRLAAPDGGVDARCVGAPTTVGRLIPAADVVYQFKGGAIKSAALVARDDITRKPRVMEALRNGASFVYLMSQDAGDGFEDAVWEALGAEALGSLDGQIVRTQIVCLGGVTVAQLLSDFPALLWGLVGAGSADVISLAQLRMIRSLAHPYQTDGALGLLAQAIRDRLAAPNSVVRVTGAKGHGKTRLVVEALSGSDFAPSVLYADHPGGLSSAFKGYLARTPTTRCTVIVDECDSLTARDLERRWQAMPPEVRLVTIGPSLSTSHGPATIVLPGMADDTLTRLIRLIAPAVPDSTAGQMARLCRGSPKLATLLAERVQEDPTLVSAHHLIRDPSIQEDLAHYLPHDLTESKWRALALVAAVGHIGWTDDVEQEADDLFEAGGLDPDQSRRDIAALHDRFGIAPLAGRFRHVSPDILALYFASREVASWTAERSASVLAALGGNASWRLGQRLRTILETLPNRATFEQTLFGSDVTSSLGTLIASGRSSVVARLAPAFPHPALRALESIVGGASIDELKEARQVRHDLVNAVEALVWRSDTFPRSILLLLRLALAENQPGIGNNASGLLVETFQTRLGRTAAGANARIRTLTAMVTSTESQARLLAAKAIGRVLGLGHISRTGGPPEDVDGMPGESWQPATYGEWWQLGARALRLLPVLLTDPDSEVRMAACDALSEGVPIAFAKHAHEAWLEVAQGLINGPYQERSKVASAVRLELRRAYGRDDIGLAPLRILDPDVDEARYSDPEEMESEGEDDNETSPEARADLEGRGIALAESAIALSGVDFSSRLRQAVDRDPLAMGAANWNAMIDRARLSLERLASESLTNSPSIEAEWSWLAEGFHQHTLTWADALGRADRDRVAVDGLERHAMTHPACVAMLSLYELGQASLRGGEWVDVRATALIDSGAATLAFDLLARSERTQARTGVLANLLATGASPPRAMAMLPVYIPKEGLPADDVLALIGGAMTGGANIGETIDFLWLCTHRDSGDRGAMQDTAIEVLQRFAAVDSETQDFGVMEKYAFYELAKLYATDAPESVMRAVLTLEASRNGHGDDRDVKIVLRNAWAAGNKASLLRDVVAPALALDGFAAWRLQNALQGFPIEELGLTEVASWIREDPEERADAVARMIGHPMAPEATPLHALLLEDFAEYGVKAAFFGSLVGGTFWGSMAERTRGLMSSLEPLSKDPRAAVRDWAVETLRELTEMLKSDKRREEEETLRP